MYMILTFLFVRIKLIRNQNNITLQGSSPLQDFGVLCIRVLVQSALYGTACKITLALSMKYLRYEITDIQSDKVSIFLFPF